MTDEPAGQLDLAEPVPSTAGRSSRPWIGVQFRCCGVYARIYRHPEGTAYVGCCPRCARRVCARVGPDGTACRFFTAE